MATLVEIGAQHDQALEALMKEIGGAPNLAILGAFDPLSQGIRLARVNPSGSIGFSPAAQYMVTYSNVLNNTPLVIFNGNTLLDIGLSQASFISGLILSFLNGNVSVQFVNINGKVTTAIVFIPGDPVSIPINVTGLIAFAADPGASPTINVACLVSVL